MKCPSLVELLHLSGQAPRRATRRLAACCPHPSPAHPPMCQRPATHPPAAGQPAMMTCPQPVGQVTRCAILRLAACRPHPHEISELRGSKLPGKCQYMAEASQQSPCLSECRLGKLHSKQHIMILKKISCFQWLIMEIHIAARLQRHQLVVGRWGPSEKVLSQLCRRAAPRRIDGATARLAIWLPIDALK